MSLETYPQNSTQLKVIRWACALAVSSASMAGWKLDSFALFMIGLPGDMVMMFMTGVHGGGTWTENLIGGIAGVLVNTVFFYYVFRFVLLLKRRWSV